MDQVCWDGVRLEEGREDIYNSMQDAPLHHVQNQTDTCNLFLDFMDLARFRLGQ